MNRYSFRLCRVAAVGVLCLVVVWTLASLLVHRMVHVQQEQATSMKSVTEHSHSAHSFDIEAQKLRAGIKQTVENSRGQPGQIVTDKMHTFPVQIAVTIRENIASVAKLVYKAKMHARGTKTADSLKKAADLLNKVLNDMEADPNTLKDRTVLAPRSVCPEEFKGTTFGYPFFYKGWEAAKCDYGKRIESLVTIAAYISNWNDTAYREAERFLKSVFVVNSAYKVSFAANVTSEQKRVLDKEFPTVTWVDLPSNLESGSVWNKLIENVDTPYTLVARNIETLTNDSRLERLVRVIETINVAVAASAYRTPDGHWRNGCYQTAFKNYTLVYAEGYDISMHECLFCDYALGPFVVLTTLLKQHKFKELSIHSGMFEDWFLRLQENGHETVVCPDSMFHTSYITHDQEDWHTFMNAWELYKVKTPYGQTIVSMCDNSRKGVFKRSLGSSPCMLKENADVVNFIMKSCEEANIICELQEGTALGALKFNKVLPWERDGDLTLLSGNYSAFQKLRKKVTEAGYHFNDLGSQWCCVDNRTAGGKFAIRSSAWNIEIYGQHMMDSELLRLNGVEPTKVLLDGKWVNVPRNPGLFVRNRYGREVYRHALHWQTTGERNGWVNYETGRFMRCERPGHHACIDRFNTDGSLTFCDPLP